jgi:hypothetical protein
MRKSARTVRRTVPKKKQGCPPSRTVRWAFGRNRKTFVLSISFEADTLSGHSTRTVRNGFGGHFPFPLGKCLSGLSAASKD